ncbi:DUF979 domain-containing protein [Clostridium oceanicum]|uniref:DUF979 domain-containing protein n=1 Tax=Clostridium oceanicum TaxID=1543 RepID=A0ABN1JIY7_9CLOT
MKANILEFMYIICGLICIYIGFVSLNDKKHKAKIGTAIFWIGLGVLMAFGKWIPSLYAGIIIVITTLPAMFGKVKVGTNKTTSIEHRKAMANKLGFFIFIPAFTIGITALLFAVIAPKLGALVGLGVGTLISAIIILLMSKDKPTVVLSEGKRLLEAVGPLSILPILLASLGKIFTEAGVGEVIASGVSKIIPQGNITVAIIVYCVSMALFTMIMGNAFAAFSVITVGIGIPFILKFGLNPNIVGILGLTSGYCGTLLTPMAANFNIVPVAVLEMNDKYGVIKKQALIAFCMLIIQILLINFLA